MRVCVVGSGGREHALAHVLNRHHDVVVTPGNPGIPGSVGTPPVEIDADLYVIGPEAPLVNGIADQLRGAGRLVFGPGADGARLEGSKAWMKGVLVEAGVSTAAHGTFTDEAAALAFLDTMGELFVVKTDGLAAGKGVVVTTDRAEAVDTVRSYLSGAAFGDAGRTLVIEEGLTGSELSVLAVCDGHDAVALAPAQDFKRVGDGDVGPNTGGMGAYSPVSLVTDETVDNLMDVAIRPTLATLRTRGIDYRGVLYCGLMFTPAGPRVLEYNVRFGDPETQVVVPRLTSDLGDLLAAASAGNLAGLAAGAPSVDDGAAVAVVCATEGYPTRPRAGDLIKGLEEASAVNGVTVFAAGVGERDGRLVTAGGRVLTVTGQGETVNEARSRAYEAASQLSWSGIHYRSDIAATPSGVSQPELEMDQ
ncbi:MAG: phosphoribosylamine--glycine ligase [Acidimicrobiales bacterium]|nr:phosphoribosylamine--glycine ligase [Acidimicrobiales bacterium]